MIFMRPLCDPMAKTIQFLFFSAEILFIFIACFTDAFCHSNDTHAVNVFYRALKMVPLSCLIRASIFRRYLRWIKGMVFFLHSFPIWNSVHINWWLLKNQQKCFASQKYGLRWLFFVSRFTLNVISVDIVSQWHASRFTFFFVKHWLTIAAEIHYVCVGF